MIQQITACVHHRKKRAGSSVRGLCRSFYRGISGREIVFIFIRPFRLQYALLVARLLQIRFAFLAMIGINCDPAPVFEPYHASLLVILHMLCRISAIACDILSHFAAVIDFSVAVADDERLHGGERPDPALLCVKAGQRCSEILAVRAFHLLLDPRRRFHIRQQRPVLRRRTDVPQSVQRSDAENTDRRGRRARRQHSHTFDKVKFHEIPPFSVCSQMPVLFLSIA